MFFQPSPILPQASGLGFAFDHVPWVRDQQRHGSFPWITGRLPVAIHSGVRRRNAMTGRMGGQRRTSWVYGVNGLGEAVAQPAAVVDPAAAADPNATVVVGPAPTVSAEDAATAVTTAAAGGFLAGGVAAALPAVAIGMLAGYLLWGRK